MATPEDEIKDLREKNNELVQKVQYWKMTAAQRENEKLELMKEINELRLKLSRLRSGGAAQARKLDAELQTASEEALNHLVLASGAVARTIELAKSYMRDRQQLDAASPRWSNISGTPNERVHRVPPMMGGQSILQPVVSLSRAILNTSTRSTARSPNQSQRNITERAVPMHMLQDVYIPLTRIDASDLPGQNVESDPEANHMDDSTEDLGLDDSNERPLEESQNITEEEFEESRRLDAVTEDLEEEDEIETPPRHRSENPLEGPSWLLDIPGSSKSAVIKPRMNLEPDSTTEFEEGSNPRPSTSHNNEEAAGLSETVAMAFTPTMRRRKRASPPPDRSPRPSRRPSNSGRVLKVLISKMRLDGDDDVSPPKRPALDLRTSVSHASHATQPRESDARATQHAQQHTQQHAQPGDAVPQASPARVSRQFPRDSPSKKPVRFDAPSPNGSTDARVIVSEVVQQEPQNSGAGDAGDEQQNVTTCDSQVDRARSNSAMSRDSQVDRARSNSAMSRDSQVDRARSNSAMSRDSQVDRARSNSAMSRDSHDSDGGGAERSGEEGRSRRQRKAVTYKEKPLNRKMRR